MKSQKEKQVLEFITNDYMFNTKIGANPFDDYNPAIVAMEATELVNDKISEDYVMYVFNQLKSNPKVAEYIKYEISLESALKYFAA